MQLSRIVVLGAGSIADGPSLIAALANYFGERHFEICLWDPDEELLDLSSRFARVCCTVMRSQHLVTATQDLEEALEGAIAAIDIIDERCADKFVPEGTQEPLAVMLSILSSRSDSSELKIVSLVPRSDGNAQLEGWQSHSLGFEPYQAFMQLLRWIKSDEYPFEWLEKHEQTPLKGWLDQLTDSLIDEASANDAP